MEEKDNFKPYIKPEENIPEFTLRTIVLGAILALVFGVANAWLGLKVGMTVSASIPAAVISMAILRGVLKRGTVLENNIVQTIGSSGESLAAGVIFTIPAFFMWGIFPSQKDIILISLLGGFLGILFMIPLRRYLIVREHGKLPYPEGTACAEILIAGDEGGSKAKMVFMGVGIAALYKLLMSGFKLIKESPEWVITKLKGAMIGIDATPALLGVGFIIGPRISSLMLGGAVLGYLVLSPLIAFIGSHFNIIIPPATVSINELTPQGIRDNYIKYIGTGAVALGGAVSLVKTLPVIFASFRMGFQEIIHGILKKSENKKRTDQDIPMAFVMIGSLILAIIIWLIPSTRVGLVGALLVVILGFFFVVVASRIVGIVGSSSSPVSGMTIATLLLTCLVFVMKGERGITGMIAAMSVGAIVCIAICMAGDASQDLKTGFLVGATPKKQQIAEFIGVLIPAFFMGGVLLFLHKVYVIGSENLAAPQATLMSLVVKGVITGSLPWIFVIIGILVGVFIELLGIPALPVAIGLYLPISLSTPIMLGGLLYFLLQKTSKSEIFKKREEKGILLASGFVAGDALMGVLIALIIGGLDSLQLPFYLKYQRIQEGFWMGPYVNLGSLTLFLLLAFIFWRLLLEKVSNKIKR